MGSSAARGFCSPGARRSGSPLSRQDRETRPHTASGVREVRTEPDLAARDPLRPPSRRAARAGPSSALSTQVGRFSRPCRGRVLVLSLWPPSRGPMRHVASFDSGCFRSSLHSDFKSEKGVNQNRFVDELR